MKYKLSVIVAAATLMMLPAVSAQSQNSNGNPGLVSPNSPLYGLETAWDNAAVDIGLKKASKVAQERVAEAEAMSEKNNTRGMEKAARQFSKMAQKSMKNNETGLNQSIHKMEQLVQNAPNEQAKQGMNTALENMRKAREKRGQGMNEGHHDGVPEEDHSHSEENMSPEEETSTPPIPQQDTREGTEEQQSDTTQDSTTDRTSGTGKFDLLVSDKPADISSFDYLNVTFERARVFPGDSEDENNTESGNETENDTETDNETSTNETAETMADNTTESNSTDNETDETDGGDSHGFREIKINESTVDLTRVVGENAQSIANTELEAGSYSKIELYSSAIDASVNGSDVEVKIPPGKLMITKPFTVSENDTTEFVFDIQVVLRGNEMNNQGYILKPVISESGVAGKDVEMERGPTNRTERRDRNRTETEDQGGRPENAGNQGRGNAP